MNIPIKQQQQHERETTHKELFDVAKEDMFNSLAKKSEIAVPDNPLEAIEIAMNRVKPNDVFPTNLAFKQTHKIVLATESTKYLQGPNGDKNQYMGVVSFGIHVEYANRIITTRPFRGTQQMVEGNEKRLNTFTAIFPTGTWTNMFKKSVGRLYSAYYPNVIEVHFKKITMKDYRLMFLAIVEWEEKTQEFKRKIIEFRAKGYSEK